MDSDDFSLEDEDDVDRVPSHTENAYLLFAGLKQSAKVISDCFII